jgi:hypothetical protein
LAQSSRSCCIPDNVSADFSGWRFSLYGPHPEVLALTGIEDWRKHRRASLEGRTKSSVVLKG